MTSISPTGVNINSVSSGIPPDLLNAFRIATVVDRLTVLLRSDERRDATELCNLCISLARGIDYSVSANEVPIGTQDLPLLLKQVCLSGNDYYMLAAIMVLMISVKNACKLGWFSINDTDELLKLANQIGAVFGSSGDINVEQNYLPSISKIMSRFYPQIKMNKILASLEVKPGYGTFVVDFHISKNTISLPRDKIRLFVAQTDNMDTSCCIMSPPHVSFLLNGKPVERRTNFWRDQGPQIPTNVTAMLKFGTNLLQAVGQFNGHYIIVIAFMSVEPLSESPTLQHHVQPVTAAIDADTEEVIESASRFSLNCPISFQRIKTPVKGHSCKHLQCFDFMNFVNINLTNPKWRCPHCNQSVCYTDIRIDQNMVKVLSEVGESVDDVIISADGSWKAACEGEPPSNQKLKCQKDGSTPAEVTASNASSNIVDLTVGCESAMDSVPTFEVHETKPSFSDLIFYSVPPNPTPEFSGNNRINNNTVDGNYWAGGICANTTLSPVLTDAVSPALNRQAVNCSLTNTAIQNLQSIQSQFGAVNRQSVSEYGMLRPGAICRQVSRSPVAVQALPAHSQTPTPHHRSSLPSIPFHTPTQNRNHSFGASQVSAHQHGFSLPGTSQISGLAQQHGFNLSGVSHVSGSVQHRPSPRNHSAPTQQQQQVNQSFPLQPWSKRPRSSIQVSTSLPQTQTQTTRRPITTPQFQVPTTRTPQTSSAINQRANLVSNHQQAEQRILNAAFKGNASSQFVHSVQTVSRVEDLVDPTNSENWRPTGRMRGSLSGRAFSSMSQYIIQPTQMAQMSRPVRPPPVRPPPHLRRNNPLPPNLPPHLQAFLAADVAGNANVTQPLTDQPASINWPPP